MKREKIAVKNKIKKPAEEIVTNNQPIDGSILAWKGERPKKIKSKHYTKSEEFINFKKDNKEDNPKEKENDKKNNKILSKISNFLDESKNKTHDDTNLDTEKKEENSNADDVKITEAEETVKPEDSFVAEKKRIMDSINENSDKIIKDSQNIENQKTDVVEREEKKLAQDTPTTEENSLKEKTIVFTPENNNEVIKTNKEGSTVTKEEVIDEIKKDEEIQDKKESKEIENEAEELIKEIKLEIEDEQDHKNEIKWWDVKEKKHQKERINYLKSKLEEAEEINTDRKEKPFLYFAFEKSNNPILIESYKDEVTELLDLRIREKNEKDINYRMFHNTKGNEGYFECNIFGFIKIIKNVNELESKEGIDASSDKANYKIIGPNGELIADNIDYFVATKIFDEKSKEQEEKITKDYEELFGKKIDKPVEEQITFIIKDESKEEDKKKEKNEKKDEEKEVTTNTKNVEEKISDVAEMPKVTQEGQMSPEQVENKFELCSRLEKDAKEKLESGPLSSRLKGGVIKGLDKWENFGKNEKGVVGFAKRFSKMAVNLALIGAISSVSVSKLAEAGVGTAAALGGGATSYLGRKMIIGLGIGTAMELGGNKIPDKVKKWMPLLLAGTSVGISFLSGGAVPAAVVGLSSAAGYAQSTLLKGRYTNEKISQREAEAKQKFKEKIDKDDVTLSVEEIEKEYSRIIKKFENQRIWGRVLDGASKLTIGALVSGLTLEASGIAHNISHQETTENQHHDNKVDGEQKEVPPNTEQKVETPDPVIEHKPVSVEFSFRGGIQTILDLKEKIHNEYPDITKAPTSVQEFMNTNSTEEAIKLGFYNPSEQTGAESMLILKGSTLEFDSHGNLSYHDIKTGEEHSLIQMKDGAETIEKYDGKMFDSDHLGNKTEISESSNSVSENSNITETSSTTETNIDIKQNPDSFSDFHATLPNEKHIDFGFQNKIGEAHHIINGKEENLLNDTSRHDTAFGKHHNVDNSNNNNHPISREETVAQAKTTLHNNINHIFHSEKLMQEWNEAKDKISAERLMEMHESKELSSDFHPLANYIKHLEKITNLKPEQETILRPAESIPNFIGRALEKAVQMDKLDKVKL